MKKILTLLVPLFLAPTLCACQDTQHSIVAFKTATNNYSYVEINKDQVINLLESKQGFLLELYSPTCKSCEEIEPKLKKYVEETQNVIYKLNLMKVSEEDFEQELKENYPDIFTDRFVPQMMFIKDSRLTFNFNPNRLLSYSPAKNVLNRHFIDSSITLVNNFDEFLLLNEKNGKYLLATYDLDDQDTLSYTNKYIANDEVLKAKKPVFLINKASFAEEFSKITTFFDTDKSSFIAVRNGDEKKTADMDVDDGSSFNEYLSIL